MTDSMVERVARAIAGADKEDYMEDCGQYDRRAMAAITAIHAEISKLVVTGLLQGNGCDKQAERNGIILACYHLFLDPSTKDENLEIDTPCK